MRVHCGAPREPFFVVIGNPTMSAVELRELSLRPTRRISWMYGLSWRTNGGFVFVGVQFHEKQDGE